MIEYIILIGSLKKGGAEKNAAMLANHLVNDDTNVTIISFSPEVAFDLDARIKRKIINIAKFKNRILNVLSTYISIVIEVWKVRPKRLITMSRIGGLFAAATCYPKTIVRFDMYPLTGYRRYKIVQFFLFYNLPCVKYVVCPSRELLTDIQKYFINKGKLKLIYNPVPNFDSDVSVPYINKKPYFLVLGRLTTQKRVDDIIHAFAKSNLGITTDLLIIGDGNQKNHLEMLVKDYNMNHCIRFSGFIRDPKPYILGAKALVSASFREGFPNVHLEALAYGTPVISSLAKTGPAEIISQGQNGLLFNIGDIDTLRELLEKVVLDEAFYLNLKQNTGVNLARFSKENVVATWDTVLK